MIGDVGQIVGKRHSGKVKSIQVRAIGWIIQPYRDDPLPVLPGVLAIVLTRLKAYSSRIAAAHPVEVSGSSVEHGVYGLCHSLYALAVGLSDCREGYDFKVVEKVGTLNSAMSRCRSCCSTGPLHVRPLSMPPIANCWDAP
jgi:hypothetical protein